MVTNDSIERYMLDMGLEYETVSDGMWVVQDDVVPNIIVRRVGSVIVFRVKLMESPSNGGRAELFEKLLSLNATEMVHGAYGLEDGAIVVVEALEVENLDYNEFQAAIDSISMSVSQHYPVLSEFRN